MSNEHELASGLTKARPKFAASTKRFQFQLEGILWVLILLGLLVRFFYPFYNNPMHDMCTDWLRHYYNAVYSKTWLSASEALGHQLWLSAMLRIASGSDHGVAVCCGLLSLVTPICWYGWFRECMPSKWHALSAFIVLTWLPSWIRHSGYFMEEPLLIPILGLSLWFCWRCNRVGSFGDYLIFGASTGFALLTKMTSIIPLTFTWLWLIKKLWDQPAKRHHSFVSLGVASLLALLIYALGPFRFWNYCHSFVPALPANAAASKLYYESGCRDFEITVKYYQPGSKDLLVNVFKFTSPALATPQLEPLSHWTSPRSGKIACTIDFTSPWPQTTPTIELGWQKRLALTAENWLYFFVGYSWPAEFPDTPFHEEKWIWPFIAILTIALAWKNRHFDGIFMIFLGTLIGFLFQQTYLMEGRYRMVWEGLAIAACIAQIGIRPSTVKGTNDRSLFDRTGIMPVK